MACEAAASVEEEVGLPLDLAGTKKLGVEVIWAVELEKVEEVEVERVDEEGPNGHWTTVLDVDDGDDVDDEDEDDELPKDSFETGLLDDVELLNDSWEVVVLGNGELLEDTLGTVVLDDDFEVSLKAKVAANTAREDPIPRKRISKFILMGCVIGIYLKMSSKRLCWIDLVASLCRKQPTHKQTSTLDIRQ
jgi:hypothetical protein